MKCEGVHLELQTCVYYYNRPYNVSRLVKFIVVISFGIKYDQQIIIGERTAHISDDVVDAV